MRNLPGLAFAGQRGFKGKTLALDHMLRNGFQRQPPCLNRCPLRGKRRQPGGNQISVDKHRAMRLVGQELPCKSGLARAIRAPQ